MIRRFLARKPQFSRCDLSLNKKIFKSFVNRSYNFEKASDKFSLPQIWKAIKKLPTGLEITAGKNDHNMLTGENNLVETKFVEIGAARRSNA